MDKEKEMPLSGKELDEAAGGRSAAENTTCPRCGSSNVTIELATFEYFCEDCGYSWG